MGYKKVTKYEYNKENPFLEDTIVHVVKGYKTIVMGKGKDTDLVVNSDGEIKGHSVFMKKIKVDKAEFRKLFISNIAYFFGLSKSGIRVFGYIASITRINKDSVFIDFDDCMEFTGYKSKKTILTGLSELLENSFIARGKNPYHYFVNPTIFWNGDRISFLEQIVKQKDNEQVENQKVELIKE